MGRFLPEPKGEESDAWCAEQGEKAAVCAVCPGEFVACLRRGDDEKGQGFDWENDGSIGTEDFGAGFTTSGPEGTFVFNLFTVAAIR